MLKLEVSTRGILTIGLVLLGIWMLRELWAVFLLVVTSLIFMAALLPYVNWLVRHGFNRVLAVLLMLVAVLLALAGVVATVAPAVVDEFRDVRANLPEYGQDVENFAEDLGFETENWDLPERAENIDWERFIDRGQALSLGQRVAAGVLTAFTVAVLTAYLLVDTRRLKAFLLRFVKPENLPDVEYFLAALGRVVGGYVRGQLVTSFIIGVYTTLVLAIVGVDHPVAFGVLAAFADIIPLVGAFIAIVPAVIVSFENSPTTALIVLGALLLYQQFEDRILVPKIYGQTLNLPAIVVFVAVLVGAQLMGIPGILLALPAASAGRVALDYYLDRRDGGRGIPEEALVEPPEVLAPDEGAGASSST
jgi:predicted PurR-regulated permease PerM